MATNSKVFVSPGVYTSEVDLSFVAQSVGVTTLGIVGETLKGPAFEPIFIRNFDEFSTYFGGTSPEKFVNTQIPKYESAYIAKSYLQQSNQLFVTRVLGLSGYDAGPSWSIVTKANVDPATIQRVCLQTGLTNCEIVCNDYQDTQFSVTFTGCTSSLSSVGISESTLPGPILNKLNLPYQNFDGTVSNIDDNISTQIFNILKSPSLSASSIYYFGSTPGVFYSANTTNGYSARTDVFQVSDMNSDTINYADPVNDAWYYAMFDNIDGGQYTGSSFYTYVTGLTQTSSSSNCATFYSFGVGGHVTGATVNVGAEGSGYFNATNVPTITNTGNGVGLTVDVTINAFGQINTVVVNEAGTGYQAGNIVTVDLPGSNVDGQIVIDGVISTEGNLNYNNKTINIFVPSNVNIVDNPVVANFSSCTSSVKVNNVSQTSGQSTQIFSGGCVNYVLKSEDNSVENSWVVCVYTQNNCNTYPSGNIGTIDLGTITYCYSGTLVGNLVEYVGESFKEFDDLVVATLRSRGLSTYSSDDGPVYEINDESNVSLDVSGIYSGVTKNPYLTFAINATGRTGTQYSFETSLTNSDSRYISKLFGSSNFGKDRKSVPLFVEERYQTLLNYGWRKGFIRGLSSHLVKLPDARQGSDPSSIGFYLEKYQTPETPWLVSELRGNKVFNLFKFITISDGNSANTEVKVSIANISFGNGTFDVIVRDYFDTDAAPQVIEKFTNCSMNPNDNSYIAKKIGTVNGEYQLNSKFIMVEVNEEAPVDSLPCGFEGYNTRTYSGYRSPFPIFKTKYDFPGEVIYNPPFGISNGNGRDNSLTTAGDNVRRTYLGISDTIGYDVDFSLYKGKQLPLNVCDAQTGPIWGTKTKGFHMDNRASALTTNNVFYEKEFDLQENKFVMSAITRQTQSFYTGTANFSSDPVDENNPYYRLYARKFTISFQGGFDGWDIYRESRTNTDRYVLGRSGYLKGACPDFRYPTATGWGAFKQITVADNTQDWANTDYYAYLLGQRTFVNPEAVNINVFTTPGIDYVNHSDLVESAIDMVENDRADSIYICTTPDYQMFTPTLGDSADLIYPQEAVDNLEGTGIDSNYTATYYPWVLTRDSVNNTQIYLPPTAEVTRNLALTDNIAFPWFAAAGYTRGIVNAIKARKKLTQEDRDVLYKGRINPIATFSDVGTVIWGNKTLQIRESALDRINVRRLLLQARKLISAVSVRLLFEQNDQKVRQDFLDAVNPILDSIRRDRGLYDFRVTVSSDVADLDRNQMTGKIYIKPTKSLEFIDITFYITPTGASFENI